MGWQRPSERTCELMLDGIRRAFEPAILQQWVEDIDRVVGQDPVIAEDPVLRAIVWRANRSHLVHWAQAILADPGAPVSANTGRDALAAVRDLVRRGHDDSVSQAWSAGQAVAWRNWMQIAFELTADHHELATLLDYSARSIFEFGHLTSLATVAEVRREREQLTERTHAERLETVALLIDGAPIARERAETRLGYDLDHSHLAAIAWIDDSEPDTATLDATADALAAASDTVRPLSILATTASRWIWLPTAQMPHPPSVWAILAEHATVRLALGSLATGITGFRRSHHEALATQRLLMRSPDRARSASWDDVRVAALVSEDDVRAREFVRQALGDLADADPDLRETVRVYLREQSSAPRAARLLHTHRNTILTRIARAERLLPRPLADNSLDVSVALEVSRWTAAGTGTYAP